MHTPNFGRKDSFQFTFVHSGVRLSVLFYGAGNGTQGLTHARQVLYLYDIHNPLSVFLH